MQVVNFLENNYHQISPHNLLSSLRSELEKTGFLVVVENHHILGVITSESTKDVENCFASQCMDSNVPTLQESETIRAALSQINSAGSAVALVKRLGGTLGIVTKERLHKQFIGLLCNETAGRSRSAGFLSQVEYENQQLRKNIFQMQDSLSLYQRCFQEGKVPSILINQQAVVLQANHLFLQWMHLQEKDLAGLQLGDIFHLQDSKSCMQYLRYSVTGGSLTLPASCRDLQIMTGTSGQIFPVEICFTQVRGGRTPQFLLIFQQRKASLASVP